MKQRPIQLSTLKNIFSHLSLRKQIDILKKCLGSSLWSSISLEMNYRVVPEIKHKSLPTNPQ